jgi:hypothetical protein
LSCQAVCRLIRSQHHTNPYAATLPHVASEHCNSIPPVNQPTASRWSLPLDRASPCGLPTQPQINTANRSCAWRSPGIWLSAMSVHIRSCAGPGHFHCTVERVPKSPTKLIERTVFSRTTAVRQAVYRRFDMALASAAIAGARREECMSATMKTGQHTVHLMRILCTGVATKLPNARSRPRRLSHARQGDGHPTAYGRIKGARCAPVGRRKSINRSDTPREVQERTTALQSAQHVRQPRLRAPHIKKGLDSGKDPPLLQPWHRTDRAMTAWHALPDHRWPVKGRAERKPAEPACALDRPPAARLLGGHAVMALRERDRSRGNEGEGGSCRIAWRGHRLFCGYAPHATLAPWPARRNRADEAPSHWA